MSDFAMVATTKGTGPFQPKLVIDGVEYVLPLFYDLEDLANAVAAGIVARAKTFAVSLAAVEGFARD